jgi:hypothetical protein
MITIPQPKHSLGIDVRYKGIKCTIMGCRWSISQNTMTYDLTPKHSLGIDVRYKGIKCTIMGCRWSISQNTMTYDLTYGENSRVCGVHEDSIIPYNEPTSAYDNAMRGM